MPFLDKVVLITGAGSNIGEATTLRFAKLSARLYLIDSNAVDLKKTVEKCEKISRTKVFQATANLANREEAKKAIERAIKEYGRLDVVVNCVEVNKGASIFDVDLMSKFDDVISGSLTSIATVIHNVAPALTETRGNIVNVSSIFGQKVYDGGVAYATAKAALNHMTKCLALNLAPNNIRVNAVLPGIIKDNKSVGNEMHWEGIAKELPLKYNVKPEEVAEWISYLASDKAVGITGSSYVVDGGLAIAGVHGKYIRRQLTV